MRRPTAALLGAALVPGLLVLPTVAPASAAPEPVAPTIRTLRPTGVADVATAQQRTATAERPEVLTTELDVEPFDVVGATWRTDGPAGVQVQVRVREAGVWTGWEALPAVDEGPDAGTEEHERSRGRAGTSPLLTAGADGVQVRVDTADGVAPQGLEVQLIDAGESPADRVSTPPASADAAVTRPAIITRAQWGADESMTHGPHHVNQGVKALVLHHTAGSNAYDRTGAYAQIRGIYAYHTQSLGWDDIGYNLLVDRYGRVFEGRRGSITDAVRGAHAGGFNTDTYGISVMGDFQAAAPPQAAVDAVALLMGWKAGQYGVNPTGTATLISQGGGTSRYPAGRVVTINAISGHRDVGQTSCPGQYLYPKLAAIRASAARTAPGTVRAGWPAFPRDWNGDRRADVLALDARGTLLMYPGTGTGAVGASRAIGQGWGSMSLVTPVGDFDGDLKPDLVARDRAGALVLYRGDGRGSFSGTALIGRGWGATETLLGAGDFDGDGAQDLLAIDGRGDLRLYGGDRAGGFASVRLIGNGWDTVSSVTAVGDIDTWGTPDLVAVRPSGELVLYSGDGGGGFSGSRVIGGGWGGFTSITGPGSFDAGVGHDLLARTADGRLMLYSGNGFGSFAARQVGSGWNGLTLLG